MRFDEVELQGIEAVEVVESPSRPAVERKLFKHLLALLIDLSLFAALSLALSPLLPQPSHRLALAALGGFVLMLSFYYFVGAWTLWGKTIGGAIFDVRVETRTLRTAAMRWVWMVVSSLIVAIVGYLVIMSS
jgi:uncharacterized RDD family membrane protein YckC